MVRLTSAAASGSGPRLSRHQIPPDTVTPVVDADDPEVVYAATVDRLIADDPALRAVADEFGVPPRWHRPPGFPSLVLFILEQQVSLASAAAAYRRVLDRVGSMTPMRLLATTPAELRLDGVSRQKDRYLRALADAVLDGRLDIDGLALLEDEAARANLVALPGIGRWTADVYLLACLDRPDLWPVLDRALQVAAGESLGLDAPPDPATLETIGERWRPHRSSAARILWPGYLSRRHRVETPTVALFDGAVDPGDDEDRRADDAGTRPSPTPVPPRRR